MNERQKITCKRYAEAFFQAIEESNFEEGFRDFETFWALYSSHDGLRQILTHPTIHIDRKIEMLRRIFGQESSTTVINFISLLLKREKMRLFREIVLEVERLYRRKNGIRGIIVRSSVPLLQEERDRLRKLLVRKFHKVEIREIVDTNVIGGLVIHFGDQVIDESVRSRIHKLRELMTRVDSEWMKTLIIQPTLAL